MLQGESSNMQYSYDEVGSRLSVDDSINNTEPDNHYQYDYEDRLIQTRIGDDTITYTYDGDGTLVKKTITGSVNMTYEYFYDYTAGLPRLLVEKKSDGTTSNYLYVGGKLFGRKDATQTVYYHQDGLGSTVALTDENGNILNKYAYDPFGEPHILQETVENSMLFTGELFDQSGLIYLRARYYDPKTGRFVSSDKYKGEIADPSSQNSYAYCGNNPINAVDPSGHVTIAAPAAAEAGNIIIAWAAAAIASLLALDAMDNPISDVKTKAEPVAIPEENTKREEKPLYIYRYAKQPTYQSLTPEPAGLSKPPTRNSPDLNIKREEDKDLSFRTIPGTGWRTTIDKVIKSGWFITEIDLTRNHVAVKPHPILEKHYGTMKDWVNTYYSANNMPHIYSQKLMTLCDFGSWRW